MSVRLGHNVFTVDLAEVDAAEDGFHQVFHIDKGEVLGLEPRHEVEAGLNTFPHQVVVFLPRAIHTGGVEDGPRHVVLLFHPRGYVEFAETIGSVGVGCVGERDGQVVLFVDRSPGRQAVHEDELRRQHLGQLESLDETLYIAVVNALEVADIVGLGHSHIVDNHIPGAAFGLVFQQSRTQFLRVTVG